METSLENALLAVDSHHGVYSAKLFIEQYAMHMLGLPADIETDVLAGPDNEHYWEAWDYASNCLVIINGEKYDIYQDGDIWLIPVGVY